MIIAKKHFIKILLLMVLAFSLNLAAPKPVYAAVDPIQAVLQPAKWIWEKVVIVIKEFDKNARNRLIENVFRQFANKLAYDMANSIAEGAEGNKAYFRTDSIKKSLQNSRDAALGEFVGDLTSKSFSKLGFNLCDPSIEVKLTMTLNLIDSEAPSPKGPKCDWRDVQKQWAEFSDQVASGRWQDFIKIKLDPRYGTAKDWKDFWSQFDPGKNDLSVLVAMREIAAQKKAEADKIAAIKAEECQGYLDNKTVITEEVKTHCTQIKGVAETNLKFVTEADVAAKKKEETKKVAWGEILADAGSMFTKTLSSRLLKFYVDKGMRQIASWYKEDKNLHDDLIDKLRGGADLRRAPRGSDVFRDLKTTSFEAVEDFSLIENFIVCPDSVDFRHPDNCVMSTEFLSVLSQKKTIKQAIADGDLNANLPFISSADPRNNSDSCYQEGFCYHNLVKLRKANIIPIGWELAAQASSGGQAATLSQVADCFENDTCVFGANNPYYHLVDPNWVLKVPAARCEAFVYAPTLEANGSSNRQQYCADVKTCLREDDEGNCLDGAYGYCTQSANVWRLNADICEEGDIYSGCLAFNNEDLGNASYLEQSLDYCGADGAGCKRYSQEKNDSNNWVLEADVSTDANDLFLNKQASGCNEEDGGCSEFIVMAANRSVNILPNGDFDYEMQGWNTGGAEEEAIINDAYFGQNALTFKQAVSANVDTGYPLKERTFILSFYAKSASAGAPLSARLSSGDDASEVTQNLTPDWQKIQVKHTFNGTIVNSSLGLSFTVPNPWLIVIDAVKLEEVSNTQSEAGNFSSYGDGTRIFMTDARQMCIAEEVGCQGYYPGNNDPMIPAVVNSGDLCPSECVGYENFAQTPTYFDTSEALADGVEAITEYYNFIPSTAQSCPSVAIGCEEFTNEEAVAAGGEGKEYFTYLRQCVLSSADNVATFYTWEGEDVSGYQLKTWNFLKNDSGAPCTNINPGENTCADDTFNDAICGSETPANPFDDPEYNPNCREFFDTNSISYFRLQDKVVYASDECKTYRRTVSGEPYQAIANLSYSCPAQYNGCRAYTGNAGNNVRRLFLDNFESGSYSPWSGSGLDLSNQSLANNGHSLKISAGTTISRPIGNVRDQQAYQLTWWMKNTGNLSDVQAKLYDEVSETYHSIENLGVVAVGDWRRYQLSVQAPIDIDNLDEVSLQIDFSGAGEVFLDNILLSEVVDNLAFVKNSWNTPASCDDPFTGAYLGCQAYTDLNGNDYTFKSFANLCREEAIGCLAAIDTKNSKSPFTQAFHIGDYSRIDVEEDSVTYFVPDQDKYCPQAYKGCSELGLPILNRAVDNNNIIAFQTVYKINDPDKYEQSLCDYDELYCEEYNSDKGTYYFKNPGNRTCTYQKNVNDNGVITTGWFKTDSLETNDPVPCSPAELAEPNNWAQACPEEKNLCTEIKDPLDPINCDVTAEAGSANACQSYYYYKNDKINQGSCNGQFDQNSGCTLLYDANLWNAAHTQVNLNYNASSTYAENIRVANAVNLISDADNDSNMLVKVRKDRECSEWLDCKSASAVFDDKTNTYKTVCDAIGTCLEYDNTNSINHCKRWANETTTDDIALTTDVYKDRTTGTNNHLAWSDHDYLGYSIPNLLPLDSLSTYNFAPDNASQDQADIRLVYQAGTNECNGKPDLGACSDTINNVDFDGLCKDNICWLNPYTASSTIPMSLALDTRAYTAVDAPFANSIKNSNNQPNYSGANFCEDGSNACETKYDKVTYGNSGIVKYLGGNIDDNQTICIYVSDGSIKKQGEFCSANSDCGETGKCAAQIGVCTMLVGEVQDGIVEGSFCSSPIDCGSEGSQTGKCTKPTKVETYMNWPGICLESDPSTSVSIDGISGLTQKQYCNQWYPVDEVAGAQSLYNNVKEAGFYNDNGDLQMCVTPAEYRTTETKYYCVAANDTAIGNALANNYCTVLAKVPAGAKVNLSQAENFHRLAPLENYEIGHYSGGGRSAEVILRRNVEGMNNICEDGVSENENSQDFDECFNLNDMFRKSDFDWNGSQPDNFASSLVDRHTFNNIFDAQITYIYFDEGVFGAGFNFMDNSYNFNNWGKWRLNGGRYQEHVIAPGHQWRYEQNNYPGICSVGFHQVDAIHYTDSGDERRWRFCNPGDRNYYVVMTPELTNWNFDCGNSTYDCGAVGDTDSHDYYAYRTLNDSTTCTGMSCLQQCQVISEVSGEGEHENSSWIRTDIWWRHKNDTYDAGLWASWSYKDSGYSQNTMTEGNFDSISTYFGGAENSNYNIPIITKTPTSTTSYPNEVDIFFGDNIDNAKEQMAWLFHSVYNLTWDSATKSYQVPDLVEIDTDRVANSVAGWDYNPLIFKVCGDKLCEGSDGEKERGITINNQNSGDMSGQGSLFTAAQFYYHAHPDHMPLIDVSVNWGDGNTDSDGGKMKNNMPAQYCSTDADIPFHTDAYLDDNLGLPLTQEPKMSFGGLARACHPGYKTFYHTYTYDSTHACDGVNKPNITNAACYRPTATVTDNWVQATTEAYDGWIVVYNNQ